MKAYKLRHKFQKWVDIHRNCELIYTISEMPLVGNSRPKLLINGKQIHDHGDFFLYWLLTIAHLVTKLSDPKRFCFTKWLAVVDTVIRVL